MYDAFDRRGGKIVDADGAGPLSATKRWTMYDGQDAYADLDGAGAVQSRYLHGPVVDMLLGRLDADSTSTWYMPDRLGSTRALARIGATSAQVLDRIDYDAFGTASESAPTAGDRFKFTGREYDAETGLYYYRARYYDAGTGRFVGEDPSGFAGGDANLYRYVGNSPTNLVDPSGLQAQATSGGGGGGGGGGVARPGDGEWERGYAGYYGAANTTATRPIAGQRHRYYRDTGASSPEEMGGVPTDPNGSFLNSLATPAGSSSGFTPQALNSIGGYLNLNVRATGDDTVSDYLEQSARQVVLGEYHTGTATALGTTAQIGLAFTGLDAAADIRDTVHNVTHWKSTPGHITKTIFGAAAILPIVGGIFKMVDKLGDANRGIHSARLLDVGVHARTGGITRTANESRLYFDGMEVRAVRDLSHVNESTLRAMSKKGFAVKDINGNPIQLHHLGQNPAGPLVEIPVTRHRGSNRIQHPLGNAAGVGLTAEQRAAFDAFRESYWKARAYEELLRRGLTP